MPDYLLIKRIAVLYFLLLGILFAFPSVIHLYFDAVRLSIFVLCILPLFFSKPWFLKAYGILAALTGVVLFFLLVGEHIDYISGYEVKNPWLYFSLHYVFVFSLMLFGGVFLFIGVKTGSVRSV